MAIHSGRFFFCHSSKPPKVFFFFCSVLFYLLTHLSEVSHSNLTDLLLPGRWEEVSLWAYKVSSCFIPLMYHPVTMNISDVPQPCLPDVLSAASEARGWSHCGLNRWTLYCSST